MFWDIVRRRLRKLMTTYRRMTFLRSKFLWIAVSIIYHTLQMYYYYFNEKSKDELLPFKGVRTTRIQLKHPIQVQSKYFELYSMEYYLLNILVHALLIVGVDRGGKFLSRTMLACVCWNIFITAILSQHLLDIAFCVASTKVNSSVFYMNSFVGGLMLLFQGLLIVRLVESFS